MRRKNRSDSVNEEQRIIAMDGVKLPQHMKLREQDKPFWNVIVSARAKSLWNQIDLCHSVNLARCLADIEILTQEAQQEETTVCNTSGTVKINPKLQQIEMLTRRSVFLARFLQVHPGVTQGQSRDTRRRTKKEKELLDSQPNDELLAKPVVQ